MRWPHVNVPAPSVTAVFQTDSVQAEHPQNDETCDWVGFKEGSLDASLFVGVY